MITFKRNGEIEAKGFLVDGVDISKMWMADGNNIYYNGGNVGIGVDNPNALLQIQGEGGTNGLIVRSGYSGAHQTLFKLESVDNVIAMYVNSNGKIGLGADNPKSQLHIYKKGNTDNSFSNFPVLTLDYENTNNNTHSDWKIYSYYDGGFGLGFTTADNPGASVVNFTNSGDIYFKGQLSNGEFYVSEQGDVYAQYFKVRLSGSHDEVFKPDYQLITIDSLKKYVETYHHFPEIPSDIEVKENEGVELGEFTMLLLKQTEEQTLYIFQLQEQINELRSNINDLKNNIK